MPADESERAEIEHSNDEWPWIAKEGAPNEIKWTESKPIHGKPYYEDEDGGTWWIDLADGWQVDGCSSVHEKTKREAIRRAKDAKPINQAI